MDSLKYLLRFAVACSILLGAFRVPAQNSLKANNSFDVDSWKMQDVAKVQSGGALISTTTFDASSWYQATVPGTVLTTLVDNHVYPEPLYGENNRPDRIPESLAHTSYWYRSSIKIPTTYAGRHTWLHLDGINYSATVWVNGKQIGAMRGAFIRGNFDISSVVKPGKEGIIAVEVSPQPHPGVPHEHTLKDGVGQNGGETAIDGPTFLSTIGWDWIPAIRDRDTGLWRKVWISSSGPVVIEDPQVTTDLHVPDFGWADVRVKATVRNLTSEVQEGVLSGTIGDISFEHPIRLEPHAVQEVFFDPKSYRALHIEHPRVWWPNGYGEQNLYHLTLNFHQKDIQSHQVSTTFGIRKIGYTVPSTDALAFVVNGVPIFIRGGDWGLDEALKRIPVERLDAQIRMHKLANLNMIRNWVGQSTSEEFFELCDKYGILVWDEFFQPNPADGPNPVDLDTYLNNVRDTILRYRNHPSIVLWCARNEGNPPEAIHSAMKTLLDQLDPTRLYQANSSDGRSIRSHGPYRWRNPREFYWSHEGFKSETGSVSIPTIESIQGMLPKTDWGRITDAWAEHDLARGASGGDKYPQELAKRYGPIENLADFVRKAQLANYEAFRAMYEGRNAILFHPATGILTWMSHPAQPSFVWQLYHYDLEPNASYFAVKHASEMVHVQFNEITGSVEVVNNLPQEQKNLTAQAQVYGIDGKLSSEQAFSVSAPASSTVYAGGVTFHEPLSRAFFVRLKLIASGGNVVSENLYWLTHPERADQLSEMSSMPQVELKASGNRIDNDGKTRITVTLQNPGKALALMAHIQLRRATTGERVLPSFYSDNYISLLGGEERSIRIECNTSAFKGEQALVTVDGWNTTVSKTNFAGVVIQTNENALVSNWPKTGLPFQPEK